MANWIDDPQNREEVEKVTQELKLPVWKPNYKGKFRDFWNECWDKIEDNFLKLKGSNDSKEPVIKIKQNAFNKPFGVVEDTILEGNKFTQMTGKDFGGILNTPGLKTSGKAYWDNNTRKLYICKNNNNDISPSTNNYIPFDSASLLERLENFSRFYEYNFNVPGLTFGRITKIANLVTLTIDSGSAFLNKPNGSIVLNIPKEFRPKTYVYFSSLYLNSNKGGVFRIDPNGSITKCHDDDNVGAYYFSVTYPID